MSDGVHISLVPTSSHFDLRNAFADLLDGFVITSINESRGSLPR